MKTQKHRCTGSPIWRWVPLFSWLSLLLPGVVSASVDYLGTGDGHSGSLAVADADTVVNAYAQVVGTIAAADVTITVDDVTNFSADDLVLIWQATGYNPAPASGDQTPIDLSADAVGAFELARVAAVDAALNTLTLVYPMVNGFVADVTQVVRVPEYTEVTIAAGASIVAAPWNGVTGGIVVFLATGTVTNEGLISADEAGFRGATHVNNGGEYGCTDLDEPAPDGQMRGEGIVFSALGSTGYGNMANGGGGGICHNTGGGGGGNGGQGGVGGLSWEADDSRPYGGYGGAPLDYSSVDHATLGGGGGTGDGNNNVGNDGGNGGGVVFIRAGALAGTGTISANGETPPDAPGTGEDAQSGGGAGGSVILRIVGNAACGTVEALGGNGGSTSYIHHGPGGGGGGGHVLIQAETATCSADVSGGTPGVQGDADWETGPEYGSEPGDTGVIETPPDGGFIIDHDGDTVWDVFERLEDTDGDTTTDFLDDDDDNDGLLSRDEQPDPNGDGNPNDAVNSDADSGDTVVDYHDPDSDKDGVDDGDDADPTDPNICRDVDADTCDDCVITGADGSGGDVADDGPDEDGDGICDAGDQNEPGPDSDGDGVPDEDDLDDDNDGIPDVDERDGDQDGDGIDNRLDLDSDNDGIPDIIEAGGEDANGDGRVDEFEDTDPADGLHDPLEVEGGALPIPDTDDDGLPDFLDLDADGDGISDIIEADGGALDADGDGRIDDLTDENGNGLADSVDGSADLAEPGTALNPPDTDGDGADDYQDVDSDDDQIPDDIEGHDVNADGESDITTMGDNNGDGLDDAYEGGARLPNHDTDDLPDFRDPDDDGDTISTSDEVDDAGEYPGGMDVDGDGHPNYLDEDTDEDGISDEEESDGNGDSNGDDIPDYMQEEVPEEEAPDTEVDTGAPETDTDTGEAEPEDTGTGEAVDTGTGDEVDTGEPEETEFVPGPGGLAGGALCSVSAVGSTRSDTGFSVLGLLSLLVLAVRLGKGA